MTTAAAPRPADRQAQITELLTALAGLMAEPDSRPAAPVVVTKPRVLLTVAEAAQQLGIGKTTAYALVSSGDLASVRIGRLRRVHVDSVAEYAAQLVDNGK
jgi:excisionase family DNA binding protein